MGQREYMEGLLSRSDARKRQADAIQAAYEKYYASGLEKDFEALIQGLDDYCISWVRKQLWKTGCYSDENKHAAMQESRIAMWKLMEEDRKASVCRQKFAYYAFGIYKHKTLDEIRKFFVNRIGENPVSLQEPMDDSGRTYEEKAASMESDDGGGWIETGNGDFLKGYFWYIAVRFWNLRPFLPVRWHYIMPGYCPIC